MDIELGRIVISAISSLSGILHAYRLRMEIDKPLTDEDLEEIVSRVEVPSAEGKALASVVDDKLLTEILQHIDNETVRLRDSIADTLRSKTRRHRDADHADADICVELKTIRRKNNNALPGGPDGILSKLWEEHHCR